MSWKILQENLFTLTQQSIQVQTAGLYCVFNALGYWNPNIAANTRYKYTSYFRFGSLCAQVHIKMHFSGQQKHISPFAELNAGYVTWVNIKCAWTITAPQQTQAWSQNEKDNYYICIPIYWVHVPGNEKKAFMSQCYWNNTAYSFGTAIERLFWLFKMINVISFGMNFDSLLTFPSALAFLKQRLL